MEYFTFEKLIDTFTEAINALSIIFPNPMLVSEIPGHRGRILSQPYVFLQPKLDGWCCMANTRTRKIYTRSGNKITTLPHINAALPKGGPEWLHGELWKHGATCDSVSEMVKNGDPSLELHVFDCVSREPYSVRMHHIFTSMPSILQDGKVRTILTHTTQGDIIQNIRNKYNSLLKCGYEGLIIRLDGYGYEHKRSINVFKMKPTTERI